MTGGINDALVVFRGKGDGTFDLGLPIGLRPDGRPLGLALGDFDRDGRLDIATSRGIVFFNDGQFFAGTRGSRMEHASSATIPRPRSVVPTCGPGISRLRWIERIPLWERGQRLSV